VLAIGRALDNLFIEARSRGYEVTGVGSHAEVPVEEHGFDLCICADVIERSEDPLAVVVRMWDLLAPGAALLMVVPSLDHRAANHFFYFDRKTAESLLGRGGFDRVRIDTRRKALGPAYIVALARKTPEGPVDRRCPTLSVVMPVLNERETFTQVATQLLAKRLHGLILELIIIESHSTDGTREDVRRFENDPRVKVVYEDRPRGKGHAVRAGLACASGDFVLIQDADLEYDLDDYENLLEPLRTYRQALVLGSRYRADGSSWKLRRFTDQPTAGRIMNLAHVWLTWLFNTAYGTRLRDPFTMYKVFRRDCLSGLTFESNRFDFDWELLGKLVRAGYTPVEIPVRYRSRSYSEGKKVRFWRDPLTWIRACVKYRLVRVNKQ
jgi:SAM-dependent methyltransferase